MLRLLKTRGQNRLPQCLRALEVGVDLGFDFADDGQVAVDFGDDSDLFRDGWQGHRQSLYIADAQMLYAASHCNAIDQIFDDW